MLWMVLHHVGIGCYRYQASLISHQVAIICLPIYQYIYISKHIFCRMSPLCHLVSSSVFPFSALVIICLTTIPCFNPLTIGRMKPVSNQLLEMGRDRSNYTSTCTFFLSLKLSLWAVRRKFPESKIPRGRLSQWAQMYSVNLRMLSSTPHHNP